MLHSETWYVVGISYIFRKPTYCNFFLLSFYMCSWLSLIYFSCQLVLTEIDGPCDKSLIIVANSHQMISSLNWLNFVKPRRVLVLSLYCVVLLYYFLISYYKKSREFIIYRGMKVFHNFIPWQRHIASILNLWKWKWNQDLSSQKLVTPRNR